MGKVEMDRISKMIRDLHKRAEFDETNMGAVMGKEIVKITRADLRRILQQLEVLGSTDRKAVASG